MLEIILAYVLGLMPIYLMLIKMNRALARLNSDHKHVQQKLDRLETRVESHRERLSKPGCN